MTRTGHGWRRACIQYICSGRSNRVMRSRLCRSTSVELRGRRPAAASSTRTYTLHMLDRDRSARDTARGRGYEKRAGRQRDNCKAQLHRIRLGIPLQMHMAARKYATRSHELALYRASGGMVNVHMQNAQRIKSSTDDRSKAPIQPSSRQATIATSQL